MNSSDIITSLILVATPPAAPAGDILTGRPAGEPQPQPAREPLPAQEMISVGIVVNGERVVWGACQPLPVEAPGEPPPFGGADLEKTLYETVGSLLQGKPLSRFRDLVQPLDDLRQMVTLTREIRGQTPAQSKISRRAFFTGRLEAKAEFPSVEQVTVERPVASWLRYGISQALLAAVAQAQGTSMAEVIANEYDLGGVAAAVPLQVAVQAIDWTQAISPQVSAIGYTTVGLAHKAALGANAELLQRRTRQMQSQMAASEMRGQPCLHLDVGGGLGEIYGHNPGKILGALYGLAQAAKPYRVRVADPIHRNDRQEQIEKMRELRSFVGMRRLELQLVAHAWVRHPADVGPFLEQEAADLLQLDMPRLGSLHQSIEALQACRQQGVGVLLAGHPLDSGESLRCAFELARAARPEALIVPAGEQNLALLQLANQRSLAWQAHLESRAGGYQPPLH